MEKFIGLLFVRKHKASLLLLSTCPFKVQFVWQWWPKKLVWATSWFQLVQAIEMWNGRRVKKKPCIWIRLLMFIYIIFFAKKCKRSLQPFLVLKKEQRTNNKNARKQFWRIFRGRNLLLGTPHTSGCSSWAWCSLQEGSWAYMSRAFFYQLYVSKIDEFHVQCLFWYEFFSDVGEIRVWFASKILTPCRLHWNAFLIAQIIAKCHSFPNMYGML